MKISEATLISVDKLHPNPWNPNTQSPETFNQLVEEIEADGFEQPLNVVPSSTEEGKYMIIGGEHRWKAARVLGFEEIPCYVHENWDEEMQKLKTVRRNLMTGHLDDSKFTALVGDLEGRFEIDRDALPRLLGFDSDVEFAKHLLEEKTKEDKSFIDGLVSETKKEKHAVDAITDIISTIFAETGDTVDQDFLHFTFKGSLQTVVLCDDRCLTAVKDMVDRLKASKGKATDFVANALEKELKSS